MEWLILGSQCLVLVALWALLVVQNRDRLTRERDRQEAFGLAMKELRSDITAYSQAVERHLGELREAMTPKPPDYGEFPPGTSFLPGEQGERDLERQLQQSEHRAVGLGPTQFSSRPSDPSRPNSRREASTRGARRSGTA